MAMRKNSKKALNPTQMLTGLVGVLAVVLVGLADNRRHNQKQTTIMRRTNTQKKTPTKKAVLW